MAGWVSDGWETQAQGHGRDDQACRRDRGQGGGYGGGYGGSRRRNDDRRCGGGGQFSPRAAHNPYEVCLPHVLESIAKCEDNDRKTSIIMVDTRDDALSRIFSPGCESSRLAVSRSSWANGDVLLACCVRIKSLWAWEMLKS